MDNNMTEKTAMDYFRDKIVNTVNDCNNANILQFLESFCRQYVERYTDSTQHSITSKGYDEEKRKTVDYMSITYDSWCNLKKCLMALEEFMNEYEYGVTPSPEKALQYSHSKEDNLLDEEVSYKLLAEYDKMMWLVNIAHDYCYNAYNELGKAQ